MAMCNGLASSPDRRVWRAALAALSCLALSPGLVAARALPSAESSKISVITFGRGDQVHQYFGHNAFVVSSPELGEPVVFNYGMFTFGPDMIPNFLKGRLRFWVGTTALRSTAALYAANNRDVRIRELNLELRARSAILEKLFHDVRPENREYLYDHYFDNCSTRLGDVLDHASSAKV